MIQIILFFVAFAILGLFGFLNNRLMKKVLNNHSIFSLYAMSPMRLIDYFRHKEMYLMLLCVPVMGFLVLSLFASTGCGQVAEFPAWRSACSSIAAVLANW